MRSRLFEEILASTHDKPIEELRPEAENAYKYILQDEEFETPYGDSIEFTNKGKKELFWSIDNVLNGNIGKGATRTLAQNEDILDEILAIVSQLGEVTEEVKFVYKSDNQKPDIKPTVLGYEFYDCPVKIDGKRRILRMAVEVDKDKSRKFYYCFMPRNF
jgi:hypothetical protein